MSLVTDDQGTKIRTVAPVVSGTLTFTVVNLVTEYHVQNITMKIPVLQVANGWLISTVALTKAKYLAMNTSTWKSAPTTVSHRRSLAWGNTIQLR
jgi:tetrahydromethanopterin S-methyltransferase subunit C